ncbi:MAG TPA: hypothetical protein VMR98_01770 [Candidatus Polarisedimenticolaceae bacterium]|nr:hypothetical protein [Candidatus Polarisedimenticolaceae bacterium]
MTQDRKDLKIQALLEKVSSLTMNYENQVSDLRVEVTLLTDVLRELQEQQNEDKEPTDVQTEDPGPHTDEPN